LIPLPLFFLISLLIVLLILFSTVPLVKRCATILLQSTPTDVDLKDLRNRLHQVPGVHGVHDLHVWQLVDGLAISSVHIVCDHSVNFNELQHKVKKVFHKMGVHSTAIQPEFVNIAEHQVSSSLPSFLSS
jgi:zinc transporter 1